MTFVRRLGEDAALEGGECGPCPDFALYTLTFALQLRKITEKPQAGRPKCARLHPFSLYTHCLLISVVARENDVRHTGHSGKWLTIGVI